MKTSESKEIFERMAPVYDTAERIEVAGIIADEIRSHIKAGKEKDALDYGCGTGLVGLPLVDEFRSLIFVDLSPKMVAQVDRKIAELQIRSAKTLCRDFCAGLPPWQVDVVFMAQVLLHVKDTRLLLQRLFTLLREGGQLIIVDFDKDEGIVSDQVHNGFVQSELIEMTGQAGFSAMESRTFHRGEKLFMNRDASLFALSAIKEKQPARNLRRGSEE